MTNSKNKLENNNMEKKQLFWIIPLFIMIGVIIGFMSGSFITSAGFTIVSEHYPIIECIIGMDMALNPMTNKMLLTKESQYEAIQWRCAKEYVDFNITDMADIFKMEEYK